VIRQSTVVPAPSPQSARVAAGLLWTVAAFWGLPALWLIWWILIRDRLPVLPFIGTPDGGPFYFHLSRAAFAVVLLMSFLLALLQSHAAWLVWIGKRSGAVIQFGLLPMEALFWYGFALPFPPLFAVIRIALIAKAWRNLT
jgi:hypothetical protein